MLSGEVFKLTTSDEELVALANDLYETYARPLELKHSGQFIAVSPDGRTAIGETSLDVATRAKRLFGPGSFVFKIGKRTVGKWRKSLA